MISANAIPLPGMEEVARQPGARLPRQVPCPVCRVSVLSLLITDAWGTTARVVMPHGGLSCPGNFRVVRPLPCDRSEVQPGRDYAVNSTG